MSVLDAAIAYARLGWSVIPIPFRGKNPGFRDWQRLRLTEGNLPHHFNGQPQNIGVLLGEPSGWLIDVDLDHARALALADQFLPPTPAVFGGAGKPRSHRLYHVTAPVVSLKIRTKSAGMLAELRSTGLQTVFPPSVHECGEAINWDDPEAKPAQVAPNVLEEAVAALGNAILVELGEKPPAKRRKSKREPAEVAADASHPDERIASCLAAMLRMKTSDRKDGSHRLFAAACRVVEHDLTDAQAIECIRSYARQRPFATNWSDDEMLARVRDAEARCIRGEALAKLDRVRIMLGADEHRVADETVAQLPRDLDIFQRGSLLVRVVRDEPSIGTHGAIGSRSTIRLVTLPHLRERLTRLVEFIIVTAKGDLQPAHPPGWLVSSIDARGTWNGVRYLHGIADSPFLRPDGTIAMTPGFDAATGVLLVGAGSLFIAPMSGHLTIDDARTALDLLWEVVADFRFERPEHRATWLAALLTPLARPAFDGPVPLFLVDANVRGAGKGLLVQTISRITTGQEMPVNGFTPDRDEMRKQITSIALAGDRVVLLDNIDGVFGNDALDRALTTTRWKDRILGRSEQVDLPLMVTWFATGNNVVVAADTIRRILHIRLDVLDERPEERSDFSHPRLIEWINANRPRLLRAALTILAAYCRAGRVQHGLRPFGSFEGWSALIREAVVWLGLPDPCETRKRLAESSDSIGHALRQLFAAWIKFDPKGEGHTLGYLIRVLYPTRLTDVVSNDEVSDALRDAIECLLGTQPGRTPDPKTLGNKLKHFVRRVVDGMYLECDTSSRRDGAVWRVRRVKEEPDA